MIKLFSFVLMFVLNFFPVFGQNLNSPEFNQALDWMYTNQLTKYENSQNFMPISSLTREQSAKFFEGFVDELDLETQNDDCEFEDIDKADPSLTESIQNVCRLGIMKGNQGKFYPKKKISRAEFFTVLVRAIDGTYDESLEPWWTEYFWKARDLGLTNETNVTQQARDILRYEAGLLLYRAKNKQTNLENNRQFETKKISFQEPMDQSSVLNSLSLYPKIEYEAQWEDEQTLNLKILDSLDVDTKLLVNIAQDAKTKAGENLSEVFSKEFKIQAIPKIDFVSPKGGITDLNQNITVRFNGPMIGLTALDDQPDCPIEITPNIEGECTWITTSSFQFRPNLQLPMGGKYAVYIPSGIANQAGNKIKQSKKFYIQTPDFELQETLSTIDKDEKLKITFNDNVNLEEFKQNFKIDGMDNNELSFEYLKTETQIENDLKEHQNIVQILPTQGDWGYSKSYEFSIQESLTSQNGNRPLGKTINKTFETNSFVKNYDSFVYKDLDHETLNLESNLKIAADSNIIAPHSPNLILTFHEDIDLNKNLFESNVDFQLDRPKHIKDGEIQNTENKLILNFEGPINKDIELTVLASNISSSDDINKVFKIEPLNKIVSYRMLDYKTSCLETTKDIPNTKNNFESFEFDKYGKVQRIQGVTSYRQEDKCKYENGKNKYLVMTNLTPNQDYNLKINNSLMDVNNHYLDKSYEYEFSTPKANNEDKNIQMLDRSNLKVVPSNIKPLSAAIKTVNLDTVNVEVCQGSLDVTKDDYIDSQDCNQKNISLEDMGFKPTISILDLKEIFGQDFDYDAIKIKVDKLQKDKTDYEIENDSSGLSMVYHISDIGAVIKSADKSLLWLRNYTSGVNLTDRISTINQYSIDYETSRRTRKRQREINFEKSLDFDAKSNGLYDIDLQDSVDILEIILDNDTKLIVDRVSKINKTQDVKNYLFTDKPLYKRGDEVNIKGISRKENSHSYNLNTQNVDLQVRDSRGQEIIKETVSVDNLGGFELDFELPEDANLGTYTIKVGNDFHNFDVQEFETPDFEVDSNIRQDSYLNTQKANIDIQAEYYMGLPLRSAIVDYTISTQEYIFDGGKYSDYHFGDEPNFWITRPRRTTNRQTKQIGSLTLGDDGKGVLDIDLDSNVNKDYIYEVSMNIQDPNSKKTIGTNVSFKSLRTKEFIGLKFDKNYYNYQDQANIEFISVGIDNNKIGYKDFDLKIYHIDYDKDGTTYQTGSKQLVHQQDLQTDENGLVNTDFVFEDFGEYRFEITSSDSSYKTTKTQFIRGEGLLVPGQQDNELQVSTDKDKYEIGDQAKVTIHSPKTNINALLSVEKQDKILHDEIVDINKLNQDVYLDILDEYLPNFDVKVYLIEDVSGSQSTLDQLSDIRQQMQSIEQKLQTRKDTFIPVPYILERSGIVVPPVPDSDIVDEGKKLLYDELAKLRAEEQKLLTSLLPNYYQGQKSLQVDTDVVKLDTEVSLDKNIYEPRDSQTVQLFITDKNGNPIDGQATVRIIDKALLDMKDNTKDILDYFYSNLGNSIITNSNMSNLIERLYFSETDIQDQVDDGVEQYHRGYEQLESVGAVRNMESNMAKTADMAEDESVGGNGANQDQETIRQNFQDLAYYQSVVDVVDGKATVQVYQLPDNLTTWVVDGFVHTSDTKLGQFETDFLVQKPIGLLDHTPRFLISGDELVIGAQVVNNSDQTQTVNTTLEISNASADSYSQQITIPGGSSEMLEYNIQVDDFGVDDNVNDFDSVIQITARTDEYQDTIRHTRPIYKPSTTEYVFTNGSTKDISYEEKIKISEIMEDNGYMEVTMGATILTNLTHNLDEYFEYPGENLRNRLEFIDLYESLQKLYQNINQTNDFESIELKDWDGNTYTIKQVKEKIDTQMSKYQEKDGGLKMFQDTCWYNNDTCSSFGLTAKYLEMALDINGIDKSKMLKYYKNKLKERLQRYDKAKSNIDNFLPLAVQGDYSMITENFKVSKDLNNLDKIKYINLYSYMPVSGENTNRYYQDLKNSILIEARGSLLPIDGNYSNNIVSSAKMLNLMLDKGDHDKLQTENIARWLLSNRDSKGSFYTKSLSIIIDALNEYIQYTGELDSIDFDSAVYLQKENIMEASFDKENRFGLAHKKFNFEEYFESNGTYSLGFEKNGLGKLYYDVGLKYHIPNNEIEPRDEGIIVTRNYYDYQEYQNAHEKRCYGPVWRGFGGSYCENVKVKNIEPINTVSQGDFIVGQIELTVPYERNSLVVKDYLPSGAEVLNVDFDTVSDEISDVTGQSSDGWGGFDYIENSNTMNYLYANHLKAGSYKYTYVMQTPYKGEFNIRPVKAELLDRPEVWGRSKGSILEVQD